LHFTKRIIARERTARRAASAHGPVVVVVVVGVSAVGAGPAVRRLLLR
jgi:hypothetical protein